MGHLEITNELANREDMGFYMWADVTLPRLIEDKYYTKGRTGAEALVAFWTDVADGKLTEFMKEIEAPEELGVCHGASTLAKHFFQAGKIYLVRE
jgi:hypothetical protein